MFNMILVFELQPDNVSQNYSVKFVSSRFHIYEQLYYYGLFSLMKQTIHNSLVIYNNIKPHQNTD